ncbi:MFS general substrate transporter [Vararia minispora EC-137]|uniref:MFS general substrate transporter n=1 Tax=Vararia minispora EC-137 TaxID=1314806 RepID=A0ACB8QNX5_9AGAM|nr:MFS general substrate transporter [Vararia minispora EC-137]
MSLYALLGVPTRPDDEKEKSARTTPYAGRGTVDDPFVVDWDAGDPENPYNWPMTRKAVITAQLAFGTWTVSFASSAYTGGIGFMRQDIQGMSETVALLGISLYVLGFGAGPLVFASLSETFGRRRIFLGTFCIYVFMHLGGAFGHNSATILATRFLAGTFGASPLTNAGGAIADMYAPRERGIASAIYATAPYLGPVIGPIVGGYISETNVGSIGGWRFTFWLMFIISTLNLLFGFLYAPVLLQRRAQRLYKESGKTKYYVSFYDRARNRTLRELLRINLTRPFRFLVTEPIVLLTAVYISVTYATLYAQFSAYPIVFMQHRGFSTGETGLAFLGIGAGVLIGTAMAPLQNRLYWRALERSETGFAAPETRLYMAIVGGICFPVGLFWFAWTTPPSIHWIVPVLGGVPTGVAIALILQSLTAYMMDAYTIYFASAMAAAVVMRSVAAAAFPLFSPPMFAALGDEWAVSVFAFLALACLPVPMLFYIYGRKLRWRSKFAWKEPEGTRSEATTVAEHTHH